MASSSQDHAHTHTASIALEAVPFSWTETRQRQLVELARRGHTGSEIAAKLGVTRNAVLGRCHRTGVELPVTKEKTERMRRGRQPRAVQPPRTPRPKCDQRGRRKGQRGFTDLQIAAAIAARIAGASMPKSAALVGACPGSLKNWLQIPELREKARQIYALAKADATSQCMVRGAAEARRRKAILDWNEGIYRTLRPNHVVILRAWVDGALGPELGAQYGISRQRIGQIVAAARAVGLKEFEQRYTKRAA